MKKKLLAMVLATGMVVSLAACGGAASSDSSSDDAGDAAETEETDTEEASDDAGSDTDIMVSKDKIDAAVDGLGDWEAEYDMAVSGDEEFTWGFIDMGYEDTFTTKIRNTFTYYCSQNFPNVTILEADGEMDSNIQLQLTENFIAQGVDCIIIDPADADGCVGVVDTCIAEGMPLVSVNSTIHSDAVADEEGETGTVGFVGSSNYEAGQLQAEWIINNVDDSETVAMCYQQGADGYDHTKLRHDGLFDTLDEAGFNYDCKATQISKYMRDIALQNAEDWVTSYGDEITCIPCCNDESAMGTLQAYQAGGLADNVKILGIDANQDCLQEVKNGTIAATVYQDALGQAKWAAAAAYDACVNQSAETKMVIIPFTLIDSTNVDDYLD